MSDTYAQTLTAAPVDLVLRDELAHGDALIGTIAPILRHLLANDEHSVFSDAIMARVRGMISHVAGQLLGGLAVAAGEPDIREHDPVQIAALVDGLVQHPGFLAHIHGLALEWHLTERLQAGLALDPVLSPLLQSLIASSEAQVAAAAMALLAAQARFAQAQRRMQLPLSELPGDLLYAALLGLRGQVSEGNEAHLAEAERVIRSSFDESRSRLGLIARLITGMGGGATAALSITHAGTGMFLSALALASGQDRDLAILATNEGQLARLALALRAAGLKLPEIEAQFVALHPNVALPDGFEQISSDQAAALLARSTAFARS